MSPCVGARASVAQKFHALYRTSVFGPATRCPGRDMSGREGLNCREAEAVVSAMDVYLFTVLLVQMESSNQGHFCHQWLCLEIQLTFYLQQGSRVPELESESQIIFFLREEGLLTLYSQSHISCLCPSGHRLDNYHNYRRIPNLLSYHRSRCHMQKLGT